MRFFLPRSRAPPVRSFGSQTLAFSRLTVCLLVQISLKLVWALSLTCMCFRCLSATGLGTLAVEVDSARGVLGSGSSSVLLLSFLAFAFRLGFVMMGGTKLKS